MDTLTISLIPPAGPLCTRKSLADELIELGVNCGDVILVYSSHTALKQYRQRSGRIAPD
jgi:aminoglycoside N3'-acetyltransferase